MSPHSDARRDDPPCDGGAARFCVDRLEDRCVPAGLQTFLSGSALMILGTDRNDVVNIQTLAGNQSILLVNGQPFSKASIDLVVFSGGKGGDRFVADASVLIDMLIYGGEGNDVLAGGGGADVIDGGVGKDKINGRAGIDLLFGGAGDDVLVGGAGVDSLFGGAGDDRLFAVDASTSNKGQSDLLIQGAFTLPATFTSAIDSLRRAFGAASLRLDQKLADVAVDQAARVATRYPQDGYKALAFQSPVVPGFKNTAAVAVVSTPAGGDVSTIAALLSNIPLRGLLHNGVYTRLGVGIVRGPGDQVFVSIVLGQPSGSGGSSSPVVPSGQTAVRLH